MIMDNFGSHGVLKLLTWIYYSESSDEQASNRQEEIRTLMNSSCRIFHRRDYDQVFVLWNAYHYNSKCIHAAVQIDQTQDMSF